VIAPLRRLHAALWPVLAAILAGGLGLALAGRPAWDGTSAWPPSAAAPPVEVSR
jgi:hypothetical protein